MENGKDMEKGALEMLAISPETNMGLQQLTLIDYERAEETLYELEEGDVMLGELPEDLKSLFVLLYKQSVEAYEMGDENGWDKNSERIFNEWIDNVSRIFGQSKRLLFSECGCLIVGRGWIAMVELSPEIENIEGDNQGIPLASTYVYQEDGILDWPIITG